MDNFHMGPLGVPQQPPVPRPTQWIGHPAPVRATEVCIHLNQKGEVLVTFGFLDFVEDQETAKRDPRSPILVERVARVSFPADVAERLRQMLGANL